MVKLCGCPVSDAHDPFGAACLPAQREVPALARKIEELGFEGIYIAETKHEPFMQAALTAHFTEKIPLGTGVSPAFIRSPMVLAYTA